MNIWAIGRNYLKKGVPHPGDQPMVFLKAGSCEANSKEPLKLQQGLGAIFFETEIALRFSDSMVFDAFTIALDLTAADCQKRLQSLGQPWTLAKSFRGSFVRGEWLPFDAKTSENGIGFELIRNGECVQVGNTRELIFSIEKLRSFLLEYFPVVPGDIVLTGTPVGNAALWPGDRLNLRIKEPVIYQIDLTVGGESPDRV